jgi:hypothetical protein
VNVLVPARLDDRGHTSLCHTHEAMRMLGRTHRVDRHTGRPIGPVLESDRERDTGSQFSVELRFGRSSSDSTPRDEVRDELGGDGIEEFGTDGHAHRGDVPHELSGESETLVDLERVVDIGVATGRQRGWLISRCAIAVSSRDHWRPT